MTFKFDGPGGISPKQKLAQAAWFLLLDTATNGGGALNTRRFMTHNKISEWQHILDTVNNQALIVLYRKFLSLNRDKSFQVIAGRAVNLISPKEESGGLFELSRAFCIAMRSA